MEAIIFNSSKYLTCVCTCVEGKEDNIQGRQQKVNNTPADTAATPINLISGHVNFPSLIYLSEIVPCQLVYQVTSNTTTTIVIIHSLSAHRAYYRVIVLLSSFVRSSYLSSENTLLVIERSLCPKQL